MHTIINLMLIFYNNNSLISTIGSKPKDCVYITHKASQIVPQHVATVMWINIYRSYVWFPIPSYVRFNVKKMTNEPNSS